LALADEKATELRALIAAGDALDVPVRVQRGQIAECELVRDASDDDRRAACFEDIGGRYLSELKWAAWFPAPVVATGKQGRWQIDVPRSHLPWWAIDPLPSPPPPDQSPVGTPRAGGSSSSRSCASLT
jgi:hypothetical protein